MSNVGHFLGGPLSMNGVLTADRYSDPIFPRKTQNARFDIYVPGTGSPAGSWRVQITERVAAVKADDASGVYGTPANETARWKNLLIPLGSVHGSGFTALTDAAESIVCDGSAAHSIWINLYGIAAAIRLAYIFSSGTGAADVRVGGFEE